MLPPIKSNSKSNLELVKREENRSLKTNISLTIKKNRKESEKSNSNANLIFNQGMNGDFFSPIKTLKLSQIRKSSDLNQFTLDELKEDNVKKIMHESPTKPEPKRHVSSVRVHSISRNSSQSKKSEKNDLSKSPLIKSKFYEESMKKNSGLKTKSSFLLNDMVVLPEVENSKTEIGGVEVVDLHLKKLKNLKEKIKKATKTYDALRYLPSLFSKSETFHIKSFGYNTHRGTKRNYNEDRVSIHLNIKSKKKQYKNELEQMFFSVIDGHGGSECADFVKENLVKRIFHNDYIEENVEKAIQEAVKSLENEFIDDYALNSTKTQIKDFSGACFVGVLLINEEIYVMNLGDCRAIMRRKSSEYCEQITVDHKPENKVEHKRIISYGGSTYRNSNVNELGEVEYSPVRVLPGTLSVSRTLGDVYAKIPALGGKPGVISAKPEVFKISNPNDLDYIFLGCDGIFDIMENSEINMLITDKISEFTSKRHCDFHKAVGKANDLVLQYCLSQGCSDNITGIIIKFK